MEMMLDLETLAVTPHATILSIGAVAFHRDDLQPEPADIMDLYAGKKFYSICNLDQDRDIEGDTLAWWMNKGEAKTTLFKDVPKVDLKQSLISLNRFIKDHDIKEAWGYGSIFDLAIITDAFKQHKMVDPLSYNQKLCFRTFRQTAQRLGIDIPRPYLKGNLEHNALHDAITQVFWMQKIWNAMENRE